MIQNPPPRTAFFTAADFTTKLNASSSGRGLLAVAGAPKCGVDVQYIKYGTVGGVSESTDASAALMTPTGGPGCTDNRPMVVYAHGTTTVKSYNMANLLDEINAATHKAMQAAGQPVTASAPMSGPYALAAFGDAVYYGNVILGSTLFFPLLINSYQKAYGNIYSQLTDIYEPTYAPGIGTLLPTDTPTATLFQQGKLPQTAFFNRIPPTAPAGSPPSLQPTLNAITPPTIPAAQAPLFALGFGASNLITNEARLNYLLDAIANPDGAVPAVTTGAPVANPTNAFRIAAKKNDLRNWTPTRPVLLCAGSSDPTVFYNVNTQVMQGFWSAPSPAAPVPGLLTVGNVDSTPTSAADPYAAAKVGFGQAKAGTAAAAIAAGAADGGAQAVTLAYHGTLVPPFCNVAARGFFQQVMAAGL